MNYFCSFWFSCLYVEHLYFISLLGSVCIHTKLYFFLLIKLTFFWWTSAHPNSLWNSIFSQLLFIHYFIIIYIWNIGDRIEGHISTRKILYHEFKLIVIFLSFSFHLDISPHWFSSSGNELEIVRIRYEFTVLHEPRKELGSQTSAPDQIKLTLNFFT